VSPKKEQKQKIHGLDPIWKSQSKTNSLIIAISVGGEHFERESLSTLVEAINKLSEKVTHCIIAVGDTLQRHNYRLNGKTSEANAFSMSEKAGDEWIARNIEILKKLKVSYHITRWNEWLNDKEYGNAFLEISTLFETDPAFKEAIQCSVKAFSSRFIKRHEELGFKEGIIPEALEQACQAYLLEECAIIMKLWPINKENHCEHLLYPGKMTKALAYSYDKMVQKNLFQWHKFTIKEKTPSPERNPILLNLQENIAVIKPNNEQERYFFLSVLAGCTSIMTSQNSSSDEKLDMLFRYTHRVAFFLKPNQVTDVFESTSNVINFCPK
jgi:tRNA-dependent cyclodipeptide synthase